MLMFLSLGSTWAPLSPPRLDSNKQEYECFDTVSLFISLSSIPTYHEYFSRNAHCTSTATPKEETPGPPSAHPLCQDYSWLLETLVSN